jgi:RNA polymerase sigma-70 factor (ECF subfamily)
MGSPFLTTSWSLISQTREPGETARVATAALCQQYWHPLYVYIRRAGQSAHAAEDTVQDFFIHVVEDDVFARADAERGRFRTFLLAALRQFLARQHRDQTRQKRAPGSKLLSLDVEHAEKVLADSADASPDRAFDRAWALTQLDLTWRRLEEEHRDDGKADLVRLLRPVISGTVATPIREIAAQLSMSEGAVNVAAHRLRRRFGEALRKQVAQTLVSQEEVDDEIGRLRAVLAAT